MEAISGVWKFPSRKPGQRRDIFYYTAPPHLEGTGMPGFQVDGHAAIKPHRIEEVRRGWWLFSATLLHPVCGHLPSALPFFLSGSSCIVLLFPGGSPLWELGFLFFRNWVHLFTVSGFLILVCKSPFFVTSMYCYLPFLGLLLLGGLCWVLWLSGKGSHNLLLWNCLSLFFFFTAVHMWIERSCQCKHTPDFKDMVKDMVWEKNV